MEPQRELIQNCPSCGKPFERGFAVVTAPLSFVNKAKFENSTFIDEDLRRVGWRKYLPSRAQFSPSYLCRECKVYVVDYGTLLSRAEANETAARLRDLKAETP